MKPVLLAGLLIASSAVAMDNKKVVVTLDPNTVSPAALIASLDAIARCQNENVYMNRKISLEVRMVGTPAANFNTGPSLLIKEFIKSLPNGWEILQNIEKEQRASHTTSKL